MPKFISEPMKTQFLLLAILPTIAAAIPMAPVQPLIQLDQFGYLPDSRKIAVLADPQSGFDSALAYSPGPTLQVRKWQSDGIVLTATPISWNGGAVHPQSGNIVKWFDFSAVTTWGSYYLYDPANNVRSHRFDIRDDVYRVPLKHATRVFFYQRSGFAKSTPYADPRWTDAASHLGPNQDLDCRLVTDPNNTSLARNLSGGWFDAGDSNKYTTFTLSTLHCLLDAYTQNPSAFGDNYRIPESGNGIPDLLDEVKWELDWLRRMQLEDGCALLKMGNHRGTSHLKNPPPSNDNRPRYYYPEPSSAATVTLASVFAHAALVYRDIPALREYADDLRARAVKAFAHYEAHPKNDNIDNKDIQFGLADLPPEKQDKVAVAAAVYLYALTGEADYRAYVEKNHPRLDAEMKEWRSYDTYLTDALLFFTTLPDVSSPISEYIRASQLKAVANPEFYGRTDADPYRAHMPRYSYHWGSLSARSHVGSINENIARYGIDPARTDDYLVRAADTLHSIHGVNAFNKVFLSNMYVYGADNSVDEIFHFWFNDGTDWDNVRTSAKGGPAPGFLTGGANKNWKPRGADAAGYVPPPPAKAYREWNGPDASWQVTEPGIYYQAAYIKLLSKFATTTDKPLPLP